MYMYNYTVWPNTCVILLLNENACVSHLPRVDGVQNSSNNFNLDLRPLTLTCDLCVLDLDPHDLDPHHLDLRPPFLKLGWKLEFLHFWPWPSNSSEIWCSLMCALNFRSIGPMVQHAVCRQTDTQTNTTENITSSANVRNKRSAKSCYGEIILTETATYVFYCRSWQLIFGITLVIIQLITISAV